MYLCKLNKSCQGKPRQHAVLWLVYLHYLISSVFFTLLKTGHLKVFHILFFSISSELLRKSLTFVIQGMSNLKVMIQENSCMI